MRVANWATIFHQKLEEWRDCPFDWVTWNCLLFPAAMVLALTGIDHRDAFPAFATKEEALMVLQENGGIVALISSVLGDPKPPAFAQRGDVVACDFGDGLAAGICKGVNCVAPGPRGLIERPTLSAIAAWTV